MHKSVQSPVSTPVSTVPAAALTVRPLTLTRYAATVAPAQEERSSLSAAKLTRARLTPAMKSVKPDDGLSTAAVTAPPESLGRISASAVSVKALSCAAPTGRVHAASEYICTETSIVMLCAVGAFAIHPRGQT